MADAKPFTNMVPGFDFLQGLVKNAGAALPNMGQWVAPTLDPDELDKRIGELRTVQFWLEQNARMLGTTIQALEVQRMTLSTLRNMNVSMGELQQSMMVPPAPASASKPPPPPVSAEPEAPKDDPQPSKRRAAKAAKEPQPEQISTAGVDPMQWWGALTQQFTELAANALKDGTIGPAKSLAEGMVKQTIDAARQSAGRRSTSGAATSQASEPARRSARTRSASSKRKAA